MKSRKLRILFGSICLILVLIAGLTGACTQKGNTTTSAPASTTSAPATTAAAEVITLKFATDTQERAFVAKVITHCLDSIEEKTSGRVKFERYFGGTLATGLELMNLLSSGAIHTTNLVAGTYKEQWPLHNVPPWQLGSAAAALKYWNQLEFEIPETTALLENECKANNIKLLNYLYLGENGIIGKEVFTSLSDLKGKKLGSNIPQAAYASLGLTVINVMPPDMYESLSRGICDVVPFPVEPVVAIKVYEVGKCYMFDGSFAAGNQICFNLDTWNKLPADIQGIIKEVTKETEEYSVSGGDQFNEECIKVMKDAGLTVGRYSEEDCAKLYKLNYDSQMEEMMSICEKQGKTAEANTMKKYADQLTWGQ